MDGKPNGAKVYSISITLPCPQIQITFSCHPSTALTHNLTTPCGIVFQSSQITLPSSAYLSIDLIAIFNTFMILSAISIFLRFLTHFQLPYCVALFLKLLFLNCG